MDKSIIEKVQSFGFSVYMRDPKDTYMIFTDGVRLGYLEGGKWGFNLATVHKPNRQTGTGFQIERYVGDFTAEMLSACFTAAPHWASASDRASVKKYRDMAEFVSESSFSREYRLIPTKESQS